MSESEAHDERWHDDLAAYSLDALATGDAELLESHLVGCPSCRERLLWYRPAVDQIPAGIEQVPAPPAMRTRLMDIVDSEAAVPRATAEGRAPKARWSWLPSFDSAAFRPAFAGLAVLLLLAAGVVGYELHETDGGGVPAATPDARNYTAQAAEGFDASGVLRVNGDSGTLRVSDLPETLTGNVYQAWIQDSDGSVRRSATFGPLKDGKGSVSIPEGLDDADQVMITREPDANSETPTEKPFLSARIS